MEIEVSREVVLALVADARDAHPRECCGILLGEGARIETFVPTANVHPEPERHFEIDPQALIDAHRAARQGGPQVLGYVHSHPNGLARPSATDAAAASADGRVWVIIANGEVTFWRDGDDGFAALPYRIVGR